MSYMPKITDPADLVGPAVRGAIESALWLGTQYGPRDESGDAEIISEDLRGLTVPAEIEQEIRQDVEDFVLANADDLMEYLRRRMADLDGLHEGQGPEQYAAECIGHDLMLTRNEHGAGFWDRGLGDLGDRLSEAAKVYGSLSVEADEHGNLFAHH